MPHRIRTRHASTGRGSFLTQLDRLRRLRHLGCARRGGIGRRRRGSGGRRAYDRTLEDTNYCEHMTASTTVSAIPTIWGATSPRVVSTVLRSLERPRRSCGESPRAARLRGFFLFASSERGDWRPASWNLFGSFGDCFFVLAPARGSLSPQRLTRSRSNARKKWQVSENKPADLPTPRQHTCIVLCKDIVTTIVWWCLTTGGVASGPHPRASTPRARPSK